MQLSVGKEVNYDEWELFLNNHPDSNFFQSPQFYKILKQTKGYDAEIFIVKDNHSITGILLCLIQKFYNRNFLSRSIIWAGPLIKENNIITLNYLLKAYSNSVGRKVLFTEIRSPNNLGICKEIIINNGFKYEDHLNIVIDLKKDESELWKDVHSKRRNEIRKAKKNGTEFKIGISEEELAISYKILNDVYSRVKLPLPPFNFFLNITNINEEKIGLKNFLAIYNNEIIGCMLAIIYKNTIYDFYAGAYAESYNKYPNDLIPWEVFKWAKNKGYHTFDFGGAGKPNIPYGVRDYKKKFGGKVINQGRYEKTYRPILYFLVKRGFKIWQKIKG